MEKEKFNKLMLLHDGELKITRDNISDVSMKLPVLRHKYLDIFSKELKVLKRLIRQREDLYGNLYKHFKYFSDYKWDNKHEIESQIFNHKDYKELKERIDDQEIQVKQLESVVENIKSTSYTIRNIVDYERFKMTGY